MIKQVRAVLGVLLALLLSGRAGADDTAKVAALFAEGAEHGGSVTIPPGEYQMAGTTPIRLASGMRVKAHGARFVLPEKLGDKARAVLFEGADLQDFEWEGGEF